MKNSKILVKLISFNLLMLLFACKKEDSNVNVIDGRGQRLVQIDSIDEKGNKGTYLQFEYNNAGGLDKILNFEDKIFYFYNKDLTLNRAVIDYFGDKKFYNVTYGDKEIIVKMKYQQWNTNNKYIFNEEGYPIQLNEDYYFEWENGNLVRIKNKSNDFVLKYDDKVNPFSSIYNNPIKNPQYLIYDFWFNYGNIADIIKYSKNNLIKITDVNYSTFTTNITYQYNNFDLPTEAKYSYTSSIVFFNDHFMTYQYHYE